MPTPRLGSNRSVSIRLPFPPSINSYWIPTVLNKGGGHRVFNRISSKGNTFRKIVIHDWKKAYPDRKATRARLSVHIDATMPDKRKRDLDNLLKPLLDAMEHALVFVNDAQIDQLRIDRLPGTHNPGCVDVTITEL